MVNGKWRWLRRRSSTCRSRLCQGACRRETEASRAAAWRYGRCFERAARHLLWKGDRVAGVTAQTPGGPVEIHADLVVGCDGRSSVVREHSGLPMTEFPMPIDVLWFR